MRATVIAVIALVVAIAAGALAWVAYDRTGDGLEQRVQQEINQRISGTDEAPATEGSADNTAPTDIPSTNTLTVPQTQP